MKIHHILLSSLAYASAVMAQQPYTTDTNTVLLYHLNETSGSTAYDSSGHNRDATYGGGVTKGLTSAPNLGTAVITGRSNSITRYTDTSTAPNEGQNSVLSQTLLGDFTLELWINFGDTINLPSTNNYLFAIQPEVNLGRDFTFSILSDKRLSMGSNAAVNHATAPAYDWQPNIWYHLAVTVENLPGTTSRVTFYVNEAGGGTTTPAPYSQGLIYSDVSLNPSTTQRSALLGSFYNASGNGFTGIIDEVRFSNIARTEFDTLVPEPNSLSMALFALGFFMAARMLRRRSIS